MKTTVIVMIVIILGAAYFIANAGAGSSEYCQKVEQNRAEQARSGELNRTYGSRFEDILHACF